MMLKASETEFFIEKKDHLRKNTTNFPNIKRSENEKLGFSLGEGSSLLRLGTYARILPSSIINLDERLKAQKRCQRLAGKLFDWSKAGAR
jgi:hypothetical protein